MGHYDDCRDAHEEVERKKSGLLFKNRIAAADEGAVGHLRELMYKLRMASEHFTVSKQHHRLLDDLNKQMRELGIW